MRVSIRICPHHDFSGITDNSGLSIMNMRGDQSQQQPQLEEYEEGYSMPPSQTSTSPTAPLYFYEGIDPKSLTLYKQNMRNGGKTFEFDQVYAPSVSQFDVYNAEVEPLMEEVFQGNDACVTLMGSPFGGAKYTVEGPMEHPGIFYRALDTLFTLARSRYYDHHRVFLSSYAIDTSTDSLKDLMSPENSGKLRLRDDNTRGIIVDGAMQTLIRSAHSGLEALATAINVNHALFHAEDHHIVISVQVERMRMDNEQQQQGAKRMGTFNIITMACPVPTTSTPPQPNQLASASGSSTRKPLASSIPLSRWTSSSSINDTTKGIATTSKETPADKTVQWAQTVIQCLDALQQRSPVVIFHRSKITLLLRDYLLGNKVGAMICCLSPALETYRFAFAVLGMCHKVKLASPKQHRNSGTNNKKRMTPTKKNNETKRGATQLPDQKFVQVPQLDLPQNDKSKESSNLAGEPSGGKKQTSLVERLANQLNEGEEVGVSPHTTSEIFDFQDFLSQRSATTSNDSSFERAGKIGSTANQAHGQRALHKRLQTRKSLERSKKLLGKKHSQQSLQQQSEKEKQHNQSLALSRSHTISPDSRTANGSRLTRSQGQDHDLGRSNSVQKNPLPVQRRKSRAKSRPSLNMSQMESTMVGSQSSPLSLSDLSGGSPLPKHMKESSYFKNYKQRESYNETTGPTPFSPGGESARDIPESHQHIRSDKERNRTPSKYQNQLPQRASTDDTVTLNDTKGDDIYMNVMERAIVKLKERVRDLESSNKQMQNHMERKNQEMAKQRHENAKHVRELNTLKEDMQRQREQHDRDAKDKHQAEKREKKLKFQLEQLRLQGESSQRKGLELMDREKFEDVSSDKDVRDTNAGSDNDALQEPQSLLQQYEEELSDYIALNTQLSDELISARQELDNEREKNNERVSQGAEEMVLENEYLKRALRQVLEELHDAKKTISQEATDLERGMFNDDEKGMPDYEIRNDDKSDENDGESGNGDTEEVENDGADGEEEEEDGQRSSSNVHSLTNMKVWQESMTMPDGEEEEEEED